MILTAEQDSLLRTYAGGPRIWDAANLWRTVCDLAAAQLITEVTRAEGAVRGGCYRLTPAGQQYLKEHTP